MDVIVPTFSFICSGSQSILCMICVPQKLQKYRVLSGNGRYVVKTFSPCVTTNSSSLTVALAENAVECVFLQSSQWQNTKGPYIRLVSYWTVPHAQLPFTIVLPPKKNDFIYLILTNQTILLHHSIFKPNRKEGHRYPPFEHKNRKQGRGKLAVTTEMCADLLHLQ
jgi:hypothetical protein